MKKEITTALLTLATALGFAQEAIPEVLPNVAHLAMAPALPSIKEKVAPKGSFGYLRMGVSDSDLQTTDIEMLPGFGLGYRIVSGASAIDISGSFNRRDTITDEGRERTYLYTVPKANYYYYVKFSQQQQPLCRRRSSLGRRHESRNSDSDEAKFGDHSERCARLRV